jgi:hypothetical protein
MEVDHTAREKIKNPSKKSRASYFVNKNINTAASVKAYLFKIEYSFVRKMVSGLSDSCCLKHNVK